MQRSNSTASMSRLHPSTGGFHTFILDYPEEYDQVLAWPEVDEFSIDMSHSSSTDDDDDDDPSDDEYSDYTDSTLDDTDGDRFPERVLEHGQHEDNVDNHDAGQQNQIPSIVGYRQGHPENQRLAELEQGQAAFELEGGPPEPVIEGALSHVYNRVLNHIKALGSSSISKGSRNLLLFRIIASTEEPLIRADINWNRALEEIHSYPGAAIGDTAGLVLLEATLRMDPPLNVIEAIVSRFPQSCYNMDCFYAACLHSTSDSVVRFILEQTMIERKRRGISWGMLAFLGDARINTRQATYLIESAPGAITDHNHGELGVCPLDRMLSGAFIHGCSKRWVQKLKLALFFSESHNHLTTSTTKTTEPHVPRFYFYHALVRRLISSDFKGMQFGTFNFLRSLDACLKDGPLDAEEQRSYLDRDNTMNASENPFQEKDDLGRLPLHVILESPCATNLGVEGERKLIQFLLSVYPVSAQISAPCASFSHVYSPSSMTYSERHIIHRKARWLPLQMSIVNGWPCYDLLTSANPKSVSDPKYNMETEQDDGNNLALHIVLSGSYHPRFGIKGARKIIQFFLRRNPLAAIKANGHGRFPLHLAIENGWPVHDLIISMAPAALDQVDGWSKFYAFQIAASFGRPSRRWLISKGRKRKRSSSVVLSESEEELSKDIDLSHLSLIYELIREAPLSCHGLASSH